jgi:hypothetical protein
MDRKSISYYVNVSEDGPDIDLIWDLVGLISDHQMTVLEARGKYSHATRTIVRVNNYNVEVTALSEDRPLAIEFIELLAAFCGVKSHSKVNDTDIILADITTFFTSHHIISPEGSGQGVIDISSEEIAMMKNILTL